jgi:soluble lytic murein transglycosylase-like protein
MLFYKCTLYTIKKVKNLTLFFLLISLYFSPEIAIAKNSSSKIDYSSASRCARAIAFYEKKYSIPKNLLYSLSLAETRKYVKRYKSGVAWAWTFQSNGSSKYFYNYHDALKFLKLNIAKGNKNIDVGCTQINWRYHKHDFKMKPELMLDPNRNVEWTARSLKKNFKKTKSWKKAVSLHHSNKNSQKYVKKVYKMLHEIRSKKQKVSAYNI